MAGTLADFEAADAIADKHVTEAVQYRSLDRGCRFTREVQRWLFGRLRMVFGSRASYEVYYSDDGR